MECSLAASSDQMLAPGGPAGAAQDPNHSDPTQFLYTADSGSGTVTGYIINHDGTLAPVSGSPFSVTRSPFPRVVRALGNTLAVADVTRRGFLIDSNTGAISAVSSGAPGPADLATDPSGTFLYQIDINPCQAGACRTITILRAAQGAFQFVTLFGLEEGGTGPFRGAPLNPQRIIIDPTGQLAYVAAFPAPGPPPALEFRTMLRNSDGTLTGLSPRSRDLCGANGMAVTSSDAKSFVYTSCSSGRIQLTVVDNTSGAVLSSSDFTSAGTPMGLAIDTKGKFLLVADISLNTVDVYAIDRETGALTTAPIQQATSGSSPNQVAFDSTGRFVYVTNGGCLPGVACSAGPGSNNISAYEFRKGTLSPIGTASPTGQSPVSITVAKSGD
jgi:6-phosphogluconolactonase